VKVKEGLCVQLYTFYRPRRRNVQPKTGGCESSKLTDYTEDALITIDRRYSVITNLGMAATLLGSVSPPDRVTITRSRVTAECETDLGGDHKKTPVPVEGFLNAVDKRSLMAPRLPDPLAELPKLPPDGIYSTT
jgi:hypothetical protein